MRSRDRHGFVLVVIDLLVLFVLFTSLAIVSLLGVHVIFLLNPPAAGSRRVTKCLLELALHTGLRNNLTSRGGLTDQSREAETRQKKERV